MSTERYHKAARDGYLDALKEATKRDLNTRDEDGMTPTLWAAFEGNLDALRLIVGRGGDPDKCDHYGNTALHFAAARGHLNIASFLVNFGVNMWSLDIDFHTPKDLAAINNKEGILRFLDGALAREEAKDKKKVKSLQEKSEKDVQKRIKEFDKLQKKTEEEQKRLAKEREKYITNNSTNNSISGTIKSASGFLSLRNKEPKINHHQNVDPNNSGSGAGGPKFSQITSGTTSNSSTITNKIKTITSASGVLKKVQQRNKTLSGKNGSGNSEFKITEVESDGKRSLRSLSGLRRDSEIIYVPKSAYEIVQPPIVPSSGANNKRGAISGLFDSSETPMMSRSLSQSQPEHLNQFSNSHRHNDKELVNNNQIKSSSDDDMMPHAQQSSNSHQPAHAQQSIFERPGFGSVAFRHNYSPANFLKENPDSIVHEEDEEVGDGSDEDEFGDVETGPLEIFLEASGLSTYSTIFIKEKIDIDTLMLLTENDLASLGLELGPRRKLIKAVKERQSALESPGAIFDSRL